MQGIRNTCRTVQRPDALSQVRPAGKMPLRLDFVFQRLYGFRETLSLSLSLFLRFFLFSRYLRSYRWSARIREAEGLFLFFSFSFFPSWNCAHDAHGLIALDGVYSLVLSALLRPYHPGRNVRFFWVGRRQPWKAHTPLITPRFEVSSRPFQLLAESEELYSFQVARDTIRFR